MLIKCLHKMYSISCLDRTLVYKIIYRCVFDLATVAFRPNLSIQLKLLYRCARLYARNLCSRDALDLKAGQARCATIGYLVYNHCARLTFKPSSCENNSILHTKADERGTKTSCIQAERALHTRYPIVTSKDNFTNTMYKHERANGILRIWMDNHS